MIESGDPIHVLIHLPFFIASVATSHPSLSLQEIDLSTEAYLMYDPTRENAWCEAVMQGLGNRAQKYTKVDIG
jgi:hypothetical protein